MQEMACPGYDAKCPSKADSIISVTDSTVVTKSILFDGQVPNKDYNWNCKYKVSIGTDAQTTLKGANTASKNPDGFLAVTT